MQISKLRIIFYCRNLLESIFTPLVLKTCQKYFNSDDVQLILVFMQIDILDLPLEIWERQFSYVPTAVMVSSEIRVRVSDGVPKLIFPEVKSFPCLLHMNTICCSGIC